MKTIGLIGGMSWESTIPYYRILNETVRALRGGLHSARIVLVSVDFDEVERLQRAGNWDAAGSLLADCARSLERAGADFIVLCTNTMHKVAPAIEAAAGIPLFTSPIPRRKRSVSPACARWACSAPASRWSRIFIAPASNSGTACR